MLLFGNLTPQLLIAVVIAVLIGMTVHEFAHNYVAYLMGDDLPLREGRLTLNPMVHINPIGFIMFVLIGFGILGSAPISAQRMGYKRLGVRFGQRWGYLAAVAAGPLSNLLLAVIFAIALRILGVSPQDLINGVFGGVGDGSVTGSLTVLLGQIVRWNVLLFVFNLLPFFPIDGWHIVLSLLPPDLAVWWQRNAQNSQYVLLGLILLSFLRIPGLNILGLLYQPTNHFNYVVPAWVLRMTAVYRIRQGLQAIFAFAQPVELPLAAQYLTPDLLSLFSQMRHSEQLHSLNVLRDVLATGMTPPDLAVAALLHDVGKSRYPLRTWQKTVAVMVRKFAPNLFERWSKGDPANLWMRPFVVYVEHPRWSAEMIAAAGASDSAIWLVKHHQEPCSLWKSHGLASLLQRLQQADDVN